MKPTKIVLAVAGVLGLLAIFALPYISAEGFSMKFWDFRKMPDGIASGLLNGPKQVYVALAGFLTVAIVGAQAFASKRLARGAAIAGAVGCLLALATEGVRKGLSGADGMSTAIGGKLLFVAAIVGLVASIVGAVKPERANA
jgi:urease gamma subunit